VEAPCVVRRLLFPAHRQRWFLTVSLAARGPDGRLFHVSATRAPGPVVEAALFSRRGAERLGPAFQVDGLQEDVLATLVLGDEERVGAAESRDALDARDEHGVLLDARALVVDRHDIEALQ